MSTESELKRFAAMGRIRATLEKESSSEMMEAMALVLERLIAKQIGSSDLNDIWDFAYDFAEGFKEEEKVFACGIVAASMHRWVERQVRMKDN